MGTCTITGNHTGPIYEGCKWQHADITRYPVRSNADQQIIGRSAMVRESPSSAMVSVSICKSGQITPARVAYGAKVCEVDRAGKVTSWLDGYYHSDGERCTARCRSEHITAVAA